MSELEPTRTYSNLTATERLRAMLDERGVEWWADDAKTVKATHWKFGNGASAMFAEYDDGKTAFVTSGATWTHEQAIAATLGPGTCFTRTDMMLAYHVGYEDALAKRKPNADKVVDA